MRLGFWISFLLFFSSLAFADVQLDVRYQIPRTLSNRLQETGVWNGQLGPFGVNTGGRFSEEGYTPSKLDYFGEIEYAPFSFLNFSTRLAHSVRFVDSAGHTTWFAKMGLCAWFGQSSFCGRFGGFSRWNQLRSRPWVPFVYGSSNRELDLALGFDLNLQFSDTWSNEWVLSTFENIDAYNLNNPYLQVGLKKKEVFPGMDGFTYVRYQVTLGFARVESWTFAVGIKMQDSILTDPPSSPAPSEL